ncbi:MAG: hypothetical protein WHV44_03180, partial [Anaerolineales bacterium]
SPTPIPTPTREFTRTPVEDISTDTLSALQNTLVPENDPYDLACRLESKCNISKSVPSGPFNVGDSKPFWVANTDTNENFQVTATLRYRGDHTYIWIQNGVTYKETDLRILGDTFDKVIYPTNREFFGNELSPGIDGDPRIHILYARGVGSNVLGYFSSADALSPLAHEYSNAHEMFIFNADLARFSDPDTAGTLAHEFQHMIHWTFDRNEASWINEGSSVLAEFLNNYDVGFDWYYIKQPDTQLTTWPSDDTLPHYGAAFLYLNYFLNRFGEEATQALIRSPLNGMESVDDTLEKINATDPLTGQRISADDLFADWAITNYLLDSKVGDGRFTYPNYRGAIGASPTETLENCPQTALDRTVKQYGVDYIRIACRGEYTLTFTGATSVPLLPVNAYSGRYAFYSNMGDESDMTLTRAFDFSSANGPIQLTYRTWYDIETDYDYLYLLASTDGQTWQILLTPSGTGEDPSGNSFGWAYNGQSGGWIEETVDLSQFAGQKVWLRFEYVTDAAVNGDGFLVDDIGIPAIGYFEDFESGPGGWEAAGFVRVENSLPQTFRLALITEGRTPSVEYITLSADQTAEIPLRIGDDVRSVVLVVSGTTRHTRQSAVYRLDIR